MKLEYSPEFDRRLMAFHDYIWDELKSPETAVRNANRILDQCSLLSFMPMIGMSICTEDGRETGIRMLILEHHAVLYRIYEDCVDISTLLDVRTEEFSKVIAEIRHGRSV